MSPAPDDALVARARTGDSQALAELLQRYQGRIHRFGLKMCRDPSDAEDVLQETLLAAAKSIEGFRGQASLSSWLYAIARSFCIKQRRRSKFAPRELTSLDRDPAIAHTLADTARGPDQLASDAELKRTIESAIDTLAPDQKEVLLLRDVEGLSAIEVADVVGVSVAAVKSRLHRARLKVREQVSAALDPDEHKPGDACPDVVALYSHNLEGEISAAVCAQMKEHLEGCPACRSRCDVLTQSLALCSALPLARVPISVQESIREGLRALERAHPERD